MFELVSSKYMRKIFQEEGFELTDFQKATLIWNAPDKNRGDKLTVLRELSENTNDDALRQQIMERLQYEGEALRRFMDNSAWRYVYVIEEDNRYSCVFFAEFDMAKGYLLKCVGYNAPLGIEKQVIVRDMSDLMVRKQIKLNPHLFSVTEVEWSEKYVDYEGIETSRISIAQNA